MGAAGGEEEELVSVLTALFAIHSWAVHELTNVPGGQAFSLPPTW